MIFTFLAFLLLIFSGIPVVFALGVAAALSLVATTNVPLTIVAQRVYAGLDSFPLMAIPFFVMAGLIMEKGGIARRIVDLAAAIVGWITGSLLMVAVVTGTGLAAISGSGSADTAAIGSMLIPEMRKRRYDLDFSASIIAAAGALGPIIPPSIIMVVIAITSNLSVGAMFLGGVAPGLLIGIGLLWTSYAFARRGGSAYHDAEPFSLGRLWRAFVAAIPALFMPVIIVGGIVGGIFTPTEASCMAVIAGLLISFRVLSRVADVGTSGAHPEGGEHLGGGSYHCRHCERLLVVGRTAGRARSPGRGLAKRLPITGGVSPDCQHPAPDRGDVHREHLGRVDPNADTDAHRCELRISLSRSGVIVGLRICRLG